MDQRASHCSQLLIVNEDWCLEGWPCLRFLSGMDAYWSLHFYALLGTQSPLFLMVFWSTLRTALVMIDGIDSDKNKPERMNVIEKERGWNSRNLDENTKMFRHRLSRSLLLNTRGACKCAFLLSKEMEFRSAQSARDSCYWAANKYARRVSDLIYTQQQETRPIGRSLLVKYKLLKTIFTILFSTFDLK